MILQYTFFQHALLASFLASVLCGVVGTYIVTRRLVFISGGITHASFGGIGLGLYWGLNPILTAMLFAVVSALGVQWVSSRGDVREDSAIAMCWTLGMSVGIIATFLTPGFMPDLSSFLFGSILTVSWSDVLMLAFLAGLVVLGFVLYFPQIVSVAFDPLFARSQRIPVTVLEYVMMAVIALTIVSTLRLVGIVLAISLLTIPQVTANLFNYSFRSIILWSILIGWVDCLLGLFGSYWLNVPSGACIIFVSVLVFLLVKVTVMLRNRCVASSRMKMLAEE